MNNRISFDRDTTWEKEVGNEQRNFRFNIITIIVYIIGIILIVQLFNLQVVNGESYREQSNTRLSRIISIEAADIYRQEQENHVRVGYVMPEKKRDACFRLFKVYLDNSLDLIELEKTYKRICRKKFSFQDKSENEYTLAVINLKFNYTYKPENSKPIKIKDLRTAAEIFTTGG